jgi:hypothetical protein
VRLMLVFRPTGTSVHIRETSTARVRLAPSHARRDRAGNP